jgi:hypothetical protein
MNISKYEKQGFVGVDVSLEISLLDYGLIWKEYKYNLKKRGVKKGEVLAIACLTSPEMTPTNEDLDWGYFTKEGLLSEDWIEWKAVADSQGCTVEELKSRDTGNLLFDLIGYYGKENFGFNGY